MASYFRKSIRIAPGVHVNLSKRGTGVSFGARGAHLSFSPTGRVTKTLNIPGTGIYYRDVDTLHAKKQRPVATQRAAEVPPPPTQAITDSPEVLSTPAAHQVIAVEHHGFYISHGVAAFLSLLAAVVVGVHYGSHPVNPWVAILGAIGVISLILWLMDLTQSKVEKRSRDE